MHIKKIVIVGCNNADPDTNVENFQTPLIHSGGSNTNHGGLLRAESVTLSWCLVADDWSLRAGFYTVQISNRLMLALSLLKKEYELSKLQQKIGKEVRACYTQYPTSALLHYEYRYSAPASWYSVTDSSQKSLIDDLQVSAENCFVWPNLFIPSVHWCCWLGSKTGIQPVKHWVVGYWRDYLSGARCKWFAYSPADVTAAPSSLAPAKSRMVYLSCAGWPRLSWKKGC